MEGRNIIITGAGQGIGLSLSKIAIMLGARVGGVVLNAEALNAAAKLGDAFVPLVGGVAAEAFAT